MRTTSLLFRLAVGDVRERTRRYGFIITLLFMVYGAYIFAPPNNALYATLQIGNHRGLYNSAWMGTLVAMMSTTFLTLAGFYLVKNTIARDEKTRVGQILASSRLTTAQYVVSKGLSNFLVLASMLAVLAGGAGAMQLLRGEELRLEPWKLLAPFLLIPLPAMALVAALAVLFESIRFLRGGLGNAVFFVLWISLLGSDASKTTDLYGIEHVVSGMVSATHQAFPESDAKSMSIGFNFKSGNERWHLTTFRWEGIDWDGEFLLHRLLLLLYAAILLGGASVFFDRFDSAPPLRRKQQVAQEPEESIQPPALHPIVSLSPVGRSSPWAQFTELYIAELKLVFKGISRWWFIVAAGLAVAGAFTPPDVGRQFILPFAWVWPLLLWSSMGTREFRHETHQVLFSTPRAMSRQLPAMWLAGVSIAVATGAGVALRFLIAHDLSFLSSWLSGALFIPSFALALGVWSGSSKMFEILYLVLWYMGPLNKIPFLDFMGTSETSAALRMPYAVAAFTALLLLVAVLGRRRQYALA